MIPLKFTAKYAIAVAVCLMVAAPANAAGSLYRYKDDSGRPVISHTLPQEASRGGYQILNSNGRVVETVAPALTEEERAIREIRENERLRQAERAQQRRLDDRQLLRTYSHPDDVIKALRRKLEQMQSLISLKQGNIANMSSQIRQEQSRAADAERAGREIPEHILNNIESLRADIKETESEIRWQETAIAEIVAVYDAKIARLEELTETRRTLTLDYRDAQATN